MTHSGFPNGTAARFAGLLVGVLLALPALAVDPGWLREAAVERTAEYVRIDTTNPPGNTQAAVDFFADIFTQEGISFETVETAPGQVSVWARLPAARNVRRSPAILLLHHMDTPPAQAEHWERPPLSGELVDDHLHGRGSLGNKGLGIMHLQALVALHRANRPLNRDVIFMATAGHRDGGEQGLGWLVRHLPDVFREVGFVLAPGGHGVRRNNRSVFHVEVGNKAPLWLQLRSGSEGGENAGEQLLDALQVIRDWDFPIEITPPVTTYFAELAPFQPRKWRDSFADIASAIQDETFRQELSDAYPAYYDLLRNTCNIAAVSVERNQSGAAGSAEARVECGLLMHQNPHHVVAELSVAMADYGVEVKTLLSHPSGPSSLDTPVYRALKEALESSGSNRHVVPAIGSAFNDNHFLRELGIEVYGITPVAATETALATIKGHDESIARLQLRRGALLMQELLEELVHD